MDIEKLHEMVRRALADGKLSRAESEAIKTAIYADRQVSLEEAAIFRDLQDKIWNGEIQIERD